MEADKRGYQYRFRNTAFDFWLFYMTETYHSLAGVVNVVFTAAALMLIISRYSQANTFFRCLMVLALIFFPIIQPVAIFGRSVKEAEKIKAQTLVSFDGSGMEIRVDHEGGEHKQFFAWKDVDRMVRRLTFIMIFPDKVHGYLLTNRIVGNERAELEKFIREHLNG